MALALTFEQSNNGKTLTVTDASDAGTDYTGLTLTLGTYGGTAYSITVTGITQPGDTVEITADDVGQTADTAFTDGVYTATYNATNEDQVAYNVLLDYNVKYCVYNMYRQLPDIHACTDLCSNKQVERTQFMGTMLKALEYSAACGQVTEIQTILATLQNLCLNPGINECYCN
jgi:hypothetical protein